MICLKAKKLASIIIAVVVVGGILSVVLYSGVWPPIYVVESESMEHSQNWTLGTINTGDVVLAKNIHNSTGNVITYVHGRDTNYSTYGEYGNVILYHDPNGRIIIHRAMFYLTWNGSTPGVMDYHGQSWINITSNAVIIYDVGFTHRNLIVYVSNFVGEDGFITVGDYNLAHSYLYNGTAKAFAAADQNVFGFTPVKPDKVVGTAFGQIPWVGLIKLNLMKLTGNWPEYNEVPNNAYMFLGIFIAVILVAAFFPYDKFTKKKKK